jgi:hypothetical protein
MSQNHAGQMIHFVWQAPKPSLTRARGRSRNQAKIPASEQTANVLTMPTAQFTLFRILSIRRFD